MPDRVRRTAASVASNVAVYIAAAAHVASTPLTGIAPRTFTGIHRFDGLPGSTFASFGIFLLTTRSFRVLRF